MKKLVYICIITLVILIASDRILKVYEKIEAKKDIKKQSVVNPYLTDDAVRSYLKATQFRLRPYTVFGLIPGYRSDTVNINSLGLRGPEIVEKREGSLRIAVIGGSAVFGGEVPDDNKTFCKLLEKDLKDIYGIDAEVINAGIPGFVSMQELILLEDTLIELNPDLVIVFDGFNDVLTILKREKRPNFPWWFSELERVYNTSITKLFMEKKLKKYRPTKFILRWLNERKERRRVKAYDVNARQIWFYGRNLDMMCHLLKSYGIKTLLVFQPVIIYKPQLSPIEENIIDDLNPDYIMAVRKMCDMAQDEMSRVADMNNVDFLNGMYFFDSFNENIFLDEVHFNQRGHDIVGRRLAEQIVTETENHHE